MNPNGNPTTQTEKNINTNKQNQKFKVNFEDNLNFVAVTHMSPFFRTPLSIRP